MASVAFIGIASSLGCDGGASSAAPLQLGAQRLVVERISPPAGPISGGTLVTVQGFGFQEGATVTFGKAVATAVTVSGSTSITTITPASLEGWVDITVANPAEQKGLLFRGFKYFDPLKLCFCGWDAQRVPPPP